MTVSPGSTPLPPIVLVHGAWHGPWCWQPVKERLLARGRQVHTVALPSCGRDPDRLGGLMDDARALEQVMSTLDQPALLCGHSYGGMVLSAARLSPGQVHRLVYLCAFVPQPGLPLVAHFPALPPYVDLRPDGTIAFRTELAREVFYGDCSEDVAAWATERLVLHSQAAVTTPIAEPAWTRLPYTYLLCTQDQTIPPEMQRVFAKDAARVIELETSHSPMLSQPDMLAGLLAEL